jgi:D-arabinose 1-dehydrogenase-like Zn-dependent alcohol dehydrogenase
MTGTLSPGDRVLVAGAGPLGTIWAGIAARLGLSVERLDDAREAALARHLGADRFGAIKAVLIVTAEADPDAARSALDACFHAALLLVDASTTPDSAAIEADIVITDPEAGLARLTRRPACAAE